MITNVFSGITSLTFQFGRVPRFRKTLLENGQKNFSSTAGLRVTTPTARGCTSEPFGPRTSTRETICVPAAMLSG